MYVRRTWPRRHRRAGRGARSAIWRRVYGTSIGDEGLQTVFRARDEIVPPTLMTERFVARAGCRDVEELFYGLYRGSISHSDLQPMAKIVFDAAAAGDEAAREILTRGGQYLGSMAVAVARKLGLEGQTFPVVMAGSVFKGSSPALKEAMQAVIHRACPRAELVTPEFEPVVGALIMAYEIDDAVSDSMYTRLDSSLARAASLYNVPFKTRDSL